MNQNHDDLAKPSSLVVVDTKEAKEAYIKWRDRWDRPIDFNADHVPKEYAKMLFRRIDAKDVNLLKDLGVPLSKASWTRFTKSGSPKRMRLDVCWQIYFLDRIDITANKVLSSFPLNSTKMVTLGPCVFDAAENDNEGGYGTVRVDYLDFESTPELPITVDGLAGEPSADEKLGVGTVHFYLTHASLAIRKVSDLEPLLNRVGDGRSTENGSADGVHISLNRRERGSWRIERPEGSMGLQGELLNLRLAKVLPQMGSTAEVAVAASFHDVKPVVNITAYGEKKLDNARFRNQLVSQIMRNRLRDSSEEDRHLLSIAQLQL